MSAAEWRLKHCKEQRAAPCATPTPALGGARRIENLSWRRVSQMAFDPAPCAGVFATAAAGAFLLPSLLQLALIGGGLWLGATIAQAYFGGGGDGAIDPDSTIDVEAHSVDDDWRNEMFRCVACPDGRWQAGAVYL